MKCRKCDRDIAGESNMKLHVKRDHPKPVKPAKEPKVKTIKAKSVKKGNKWVKWVGGNWQMTPAYEKQLKLEGIDVALDGLGNYLNVNDLESAAMDMVQYDDRMTEAGVPEYHTIRECAADAFYDGLLKGKAIAIAEGRNLVMPGY